MSKLEQLKATIAQTVECQLTTTPQGRALLAHDEAAVRKLMRAVVNNLCMSVAGEFLPEALEMEAA